MKLRLVPIISRKANVVDLSAIEAMFDPAHDEWDDAELMEASGDTIRHAERRDGELYVAVLWRVPTGSERSRIMADYPDYISIEEALHATGQD